MKRHRWPRKAKKWAKKNNAVLISVQGRKMWYGRNLGYVRLPNQTTATLYAVKP